MTCLIFIKLQPYFEKLYPKVILKLFFIGAKSRLNQGLLKRKNVAITTVLSCKSLRKAIMNRSKLKNKYNK